MGAVKGKECCAGGLVRKKDVRDAFSGLMKAVVGVLLIASGCGMFVLSGDGSSTFAFTSALIGAIALLTLGFVCVASGCCEVHEAFLG